MLRYLTSPVEITGSGNAEALRFGRNEMVASTSPARCQPGLAATEGSLDTGLVLRSIGYRGNPSPVSRSTSSAA